GRAPNLRIIPGTAHPASGGSIHACAIVGIALTCRSSCKIMSANGQHLSTGVGTEQAHSPFTSIGIAITCCHYQHGIGEVPAHAHQQTVITATEAVKQQSTQYILGYYSSVTLHSAVDTGPCTEAGATVCTGTDVDDLSTAVQCQDGIGKKAVNGAGTAVADAYIDATVSTCFAKRPQQTSRTTITQLRSNQAEHIGTMDGFLGSGAATIRRKQTDIAGAAATVSSVTIEVRTGEMDATFEHTHGTEERHDRTITLRMHTLDIQLSTLFHPVGGTLTGDIRVGTPVDAQRFRLQVDIHQHIFDLRMGLETVGGGFKLLETGGRQAQLTTAQQVDATNDFTTLGSSGCGGNRIQVSTFGNEDQQQVVGNLGTAVGLLQLIGSWRNDGDRVADGKAHAIALAAAQTQKHCLVTGQTGRHHKHHPLFGDDLRQDDLVTQHHPQIVMV